MKYIIIAILMSAAISRALFVFSSKEKKQRLRRFWNELIQNLLIAIVLYYAFFLGLAYFRR